MQRQFFFFDPDKLKKTHTYLFVRFRFWKRDYHLQSFFLIYMGCFPSKVLPHHTEETRERVMEVFGAPTMIVLPLMRQPPPFTILLPDWFVADARMTEEMHMLLIQSWEACSKCKRQARRFRHSSRSNFSGMNLSQEEGKFASIMMPALSVMAITEETEESALVLFFDRLCTNWWLCDMMLSTCFVSKKDTIDFITTCVMVLIKKIPPTLHATGNKQPQQQQQTMQKDMCDLQECLHKMVHDYHKYELTVDKYDRFFSALLKTLKDFLQTDFTMQIRTVWLTVFSKFLSLMLPLLHERHEENKEGQVQYNRTRYCLRKMH